MQDTNLKNFFSYFYNNTPVPFYDKDKLFKKFVDNINHPEKYITKQNVLKLIERSKLERNTNVENIKDEDKIIAYMIIEVVLGIDAGVFSAINYKLKPVTGYNTLYDYSNRKQKFYELVGHKYSSLVYSIYDSIYQYNNALSTLANKYNFKINIENEPEKIEIIVYVNNFILREIIDTDQITKEVPLLDKKIESYLNCCNSILKDIDICNELKEENRLLFSHNTSQDIHAVTYDFSMGSMLSYNKDILSYYVRIVQKYHENVICLYNYDGECRFNSNEYINGINIDTIKELINNIKDCNGKPYEYEITIENLPTNQYLFDSTSSAINRLTEHDGSIRDGNFYMLTEEIDKDLFISITDSYTIKDDNHNCGEGRVGIVMSVYTFKKDYDIHAYLMNLKKLYYHYVNKYQCSLNIASQDDFYAAFDDATILDLGQTKKELAKIY